MNDGTFFYNFKKLKKVKEKLIFVKFAPKRSAQKGTATKWANSKMATTKRAIKSCIHQGHAYLNKSTITVISLNFKDFLTFRTPTVRKSFSSTIIKSTKTSTKNS